jgi:hypothetical protein
MHASMIVQGYFDERFPVVTDRADAIALASSALVHRGRALRPAIAATLAALALAALAGIAAWDDPASRSAALLPLGLILASLAALGLATLIASGLLWRARLVRLVADWELRTAVGPELRSAEPIALASNLGA